MGRRCSYCGINGHNSRTCDSSRAHDCGLKLFGFKLQVASPPPPPLPMKRCLSMDFSTNALPSSSSSPASSTSSSSSLGGSTGKLCNGNLLGILGRNAERKKGVPWSEEEHRVFLVGLEKLGKGDWRGISRRFVTTRTPTQVASHAQKYFLRQSSVGKKKRRSSLFDTMEHSGRACHATTDSYKLSDPSLSAEPHLHSLSLDSRSQGVHDEVQNDLNSDSHQARQNSSCLNLMPGCSSITDAALETQPSSALDKPDLVNFSLPDLELKISLSRSIDKNGISVT